MKGMIMLLAHLSKPREGKKKKKSKTEALFSHSHQTKSATE